MAEERINNVQEGEVKQVLTLTNTWELRLQWKTAVICTLTTSVGGEMQLV